MRSKSVRHAHAGERHYMVTDRRTLPSLRKGWTRIWHDFLVIHKQLAYWVERYLLMDLPIGTVSRFPSEVPMSWTYRLSLEDGCNPRIETERVVACEDFDLILNR